MTQSRHALKQSASIDWSAVRRNYPAAKEWVFLNAGSRGLLSEKAHAAGLAQLGADRLMRPDSPASDQQLAEIRPLFGRLIHAEPDTIAVTLNVSHGLNMAGSALDWCSGDELVMSSALEHANNVHLWQALASRGVLIRGIPPVDGALDTEAMIAAIGSRTRLVSVSAVSMAPGFRADLPRLGHAARAAGALFLVDAVQACGVLSLDVVRDGIDALATSTSKGLLGARGLGFLYVSPRWIERLTPVFVARNSIVSKGHYSELEVGRFSFRADGRRFECGNYNYTGVAIARQALHDILDLGIEAIEDRAVHLATELASGLSGLGMPVANPPDAQRRTHLVTLGQLGAGGADSTGDARLDRFGQALEAARVKFAMRRGMLRFGFHFYNDESDVATVIDIARRVS